MVDPLRFTPWAGSPGLIETVTLGPPVGSLAALAGGASFAGAGSVGSATITGALVAQAQAAGFAGGSGVPAGQDLRLLPTASDLFAWYRPENGLTVSPTLFASGSGTLPEVTISGPLDVPIGWHIQPVSSSTFLWSMDNGWTWQENKVARAIATSVDLGNGYVLGFGAGTYATDQRFVAAAQSLASLGTAANCTLDNSSVYAAAGSLIRTWGINNRRPALRCTPQSTNGTLGNASGLPALINGTNKPFHIFQVVQWISNNLGSPFPASAWGFSSSASTTDNYLNDVCFSPAAGGKYTAQRRAPGGALQSANFALSMDFAPHIRELEYDGVNATLRIDGHTLGSVPWSSGALSTDRFLLCGVKFGATAAALGRCDCSDFAAYQRVLSESERWGVYGCLS